MDTDHDADGCEDYEVSPDGELVGLREARTMLGELADRARYRDEVTYLTKHGKVVASMVPADAARTSAQAEAAIADRRRILQEADRRRADLIGELHRQVNTHERHWAQALVALCGAVEDLAAADPHRAALALRQAQRLRAHAEGVLAGERTWTGDPAG
jgi:antitoxin (DNA-binding transcriptional repressor) of toxin-antitoxin stability system